MIILFALLTAASLAKQLQPSDIALAIDCGSETSFQSNDRLPYSEVLLSLPYRINFSLANPEWPTTPTTKWYRMGSSSHITPRSTLLNGMANPSAIDCPYKMAITLLFCSLWKY